MRSYLSNNSTARFDLWSQGTQAQPMVLARPRRLSDNLHMDLAATRRLARPSFLEEQEGDAMKVLRLAWLPALGLILSLPTGGVANPLTYTFTQVTDSSGAFSTFVGGASINDEGTVAFLATLSAGGEAIVVGNGQSTTPLYATGGSAGLNCQARRKRTGRSAQRRQHRPIRTTPTFCANDQPG